MEKKSQNRATQIGIWSALAGGALGFTLGMLFAPQRGPDTRRRLAYQLEHLAAQAEGFLRRLSQRPSGLETQPSQTGDEVVADAEARANHIRDDIDALLEELRQQSAASSDPTDAD
jgi:gas vesicle protein